MFENNKTFPFVYITKLNQRERFPFVYKKKLNQREHFPFVYKGKTYRNCIESTTRGLSPWCATVPVLPNNKKDAGYRWGRCQMTSKI